MRLLGESGEKLLKLIGLGLGLKDPGHFASPDQRFFFTIYVFSEFLRSTRQIAREKSDGESGHIRTMAFSSSQVRLTWVIFSSDLRVLQKIELRIGRRVLPGCTKTTKTGCSFHLLRIP